MVKIILMILLIIIIWIIYKNIYYKGNNFNELKEGIMDYVVNFNLMNEHIEQLKRSYDTIAKTNYAKAEPINSRKHNHKKSKVEKLEFICECSASDFKNTEKYPFKYICKYFNIKSDEETLELFETALNNFSACREGQLLLIKEIKKIKYSIESQVPFLIRLFSMYEVMSKLGFEKVDTTLNYFPTYTFKYISHGSKKTNTYSIVLDTENLNEFIQYLSDMVELENGDEEQRVLLTSKLRNKIKQRDNYTCQKCGMSVIDEKNLLLEVHHIISPSKGGLTAEENLHTLCWKCTISKFTKLN